MIQSDALKTAGKKGSRLNRLFVGAIIFIELIIVAVLVFVAGRALGFFDGDKSTSFQVIGSKDFYSLLAIGIILLWIGIMIGFYAWAIYFYNINLGLTNLEWAEVRERYGYIPENADDVREENPHKDQTLGLPPGTLRGTIALTLLVGGLSMAIASLGMDSKLAADSFLVDHFDFFKTAFLMMIAFYFGNKALETIGYKSTKLIGRSSNGNSPTTNTANGPSGNSFDDRSVNAPLSPVSRQAQQQAEVLKTGTPVAETYDPNTVAADAQSDFNNPKAVQ